MSTHPLFDESRHSLQWHRIRGLPTFWLGLISLIISLFGVLARVEEFAPLRKFGREVLAAIPPGGTFYREHFYFYFEKFPFASVFTLLGLVLLVWGAVELHAASRLKRELLQVEDARRRRQMLKELESDDDVAPSK